MGRLTRIYSPIWCFGRPIGQPIELKWFLLGLVAIHATISGAAVIDEEPPRPVSRVEPTEPNQTINGFQLASGFHIELVASEPLIRDPVAIDFDANGNLYVVEYPEFNHYSFKSPLEASGSIKLLRDTNRDGCFDQATVFLENIEFPTAVLCYDGGVFVGASPDVLYCKDTNDDGRADVQKVVLTGFGRDFAGGGLLNSFRWGLDNRIHIATSFSGGSIRRPSRPEDPLTPVRGRQVILDPRTENFELMSGGGQHGMSMDNRGRTFLCSNIYPMQMLMYDGRYTARNPFFAPPNPLIDIHHEGRLMRLNRISPLEPWRIFRSRNTGASLPENDEQRVPGGLFTSASGITIYRGNSWPCEFQENLFVGEVANNLVYRATLQKSGLELTATRVDNKVEFLASRDPWFRPVQLANAPDGNLYVVDMYREIIEGAAFIPPRMLEELEPSNGTKLGRIYRIVFDSPKSTESHPEDNPSPETIPMWPSKPKDWVPMLGHPNGWHRDTAARLLYERKSVEVVEEIRSFALQSENALGRIHALYALRGLGQLDPDTLLRSLSDSDSLVRIHAIRLSELVAPFSTTICDTLCSMAHDKDPDVRFQLAFSLGAFTGGERDQTLVALVKQDGENPWVRTAVQSALWQGSGEIFFELVTDKSYRNSPSAASFLISLAFQASVQKQRKDLLFVIKGLQNLSENEQVLMKKILQGAGLDLEKFFSTEKTNNFRRLLSRWIEDAAKIAQDSNQPSDERVNAIHTLQFADFDTARTQSLFIRLLQSRQPVSVQMAAIATLDRMDSDAVFDVLLKSWVGLSPDLRSRAMETLLSRKSWIVRTLDAYEAGTLVSGIFSNRYLSRLMTNPDPSIQVRARNLRPHVTTTKKQGLIIQYLDALKTPGNPGRGKAIFKSQCAACHTFGKLGNLIGGDLTDLSKRPAEEIITDILEPNSKVESPFMSYVLTTNQGRIWNGMIVDDTENSISLRRVDGSEVRLLRLQIESLRSTGLSFMPEGFENQIDIRQMSDLVSFLTQTLGSK